MLRCACEFCSAALELPDHLAGKPFVCPNCGRSFTLPAPGGDVPVQQGFMDQLLRSAEEQRIGALPPPPRTTDFETVAQDEPPPVPLPVPLPAVAPPSRPRYPDNEPPAWQPRRSRPPRPRELPPEEEDAEGDYFQTPAKRGGHSPRYLVGCSRAGLILSLIALLSVLIGLFVYLNAVRKGDGLGTVALYLVLSGVGFFAFVLALLGVIFSGRGLDPANEINRGAAVGGLVCGILGLCVSAIAGSFTLFCGVFLHLRM